jgi:hypothetical protein
MNASRAAILAAAVLVMPGWAMAETEWMGSARQWSVGYVGDMPLPYCRLQWDSQTGETVEFRESMKNALWLVGKTTWTIPEHTKTQVDVVGHDNTVSVPAEFFDKNSLRLWDVPGSPNSGGIQAIVKTAFSGMPDLELDFAGDEPNWSVPTSRVVELRSTFSQCLKRLAKPDMAKSAAETSKPF